MLKFIVKISSILFIAVGISIWLINDTLNHNIELSYYKFTGEHKSLIIGSSKARFAINPKYFDPKLDLFNYAFTNATSPYGPLYLKAIKSTLKEDPKNNALFILEVNPYNLSTDITSHYEFSEEKNALGRQWCLNASPNYEYVFRNLTPLYQHIEYPDTALYVQHTNGFNEILDKQTKDKYDEYKKKKISDYTKQNVNDRPSKKRIEYFIQTILFLKKHGQVVLVHLPTDKELAKIEEMYWSDYLLTIKKIANNEKVPFINLQETFSSPNTLDGVHVLSTESNKISAYLSKEIDSILKTK